MDRWSAERRRRLLIVGLAGIALGVAVVEIVAEPGAGAAPPTGVRIVESELGKVAILAPPGARCQALVTLPTGVVRPHQIGDAVVVGPDGGATWTYQASAPTLGRGTYTVTCSIGSSTYTARSEFTLTDRD